jgi:hypothetical protein
MYELIYICIYVTKCMNYVYVCLAFVWTWCMLLDTYCILFHKLYTYCVFFYKLNADCVFLSSSNWWANISTPVATVDSSSDGRITSARPSLLGVTVATCILCPSLLNYHYSDVLVTTDRLPVTTVTYGMLLQWLFVVVRLWNGATMYRHSRV